jgi:hypothetical protein
MNEAKKHAQFVVKQQFSSLEIISNLYIQKGTLIKDFNNSFTQL